MGIGPIAYLMPLPLAHSIQAALDPLPMERVAPSARTGEETYSSHGGKSARGSEDDASDEDIESGFRAPDEEGGDHAGLGAALGLPLRRH